MDQIELQLVDCKQGYKAIHILINGRSLIDLVRRIEQPFANQEGRPHAAGEYEWVAAVNCELIDTLSQNVTVLGCTCGVEECWPLLCKVEHSTDLVRWSEFFNPYRTAQTVANFNDPAHRLIKPWDHSGLGPFTFSRKQYDTAFLLLGHF
jgi:hypothetical protein